MANPAFTKEDLLALWRAVFPESYTAPVEFNGETEGFDVPSAQAAIMASLSLAIEIATQAYFLKAHSIQTQPPASGEAPSTTTVTITREAPMGFQVDIDNPDAFTLEAVQLDSFGVSRVVAEFKITEAIFWAEGEAIPRRKIDQVQLTDGVPVVSVVTGHDQNIPAGLITQFKVQGSARVRPAAHILIDFGVSGMEMPPVDPINREDRLTVNMQGRYARVLGLSTGAFPPVQIRGLTNVTGGSQTAVLSPSLPAPTLLETNLTIQVEEWADLGFTVSQPLPAEGGTYGWLDAIGNDRGQGRAPGETDVLYRERLCVLDDTISPAAIQRICIRDYEQKTGLQCVLYETRDFETWPGLVYDVPVPLGPTSPGNFPRFTIYDADQSNFPGLQRLDDSYLSEGMLRRFFVICLEIPVDASGFFWDTVANPIGGAGGNPFNAFDLGTSGTIGTRAAFFDGFDVVASSASAELFKAIDAARAVGVGFIILRDPFLSA